MAPGTPGYDSAGELLAANAADVLVLATPVAAHLPDARLAAEHGVPVLIEKPPARTVAEALELGELSPQPWIAFNRRFEPDLRALRRAAEAAEPLDLSLVLHTRPGSWRPYEVEDDVLLNLGPHLVDLAFWLSGSGPGEVRGRAGVNRAVLSIQLGERGIARIECVANRPYRERVEVRTNGKSLARYERGGMRQGLLAVLGARTESPLVPSLAAQLEAFARVVRGGSEPDLATASDALVVMRTLEAAQRVRVTT
jgi:predicted dehydrogenase